jgi:hypothetical protein
MSVQEKTRPKRRTGATARVLALGCFVGRAPRRTGKPDWFVAMEFRRQAKATLSQIPIEELAKAGVPMGQVELLAAYYASIWDLATTKVEQLRRIPGIGDRTLKKVWQALKTRHVSPDWSVD